MLIQHLGMLCYISNPAFCNLKDRHSLKKSTEGSCFCKINKNFNRFILQNKRIALTLLYTSQHGPV